MLGTLFLVTSRYAAPSETISDHLAAHRAWLDDLYRRGTFILSGRLQSGGGGFMLARGIGRHDLDAVLATDPFRLRNLLVHEVVELAPTRWVAALDGLAGEAP